MIKKAGILIIEKDSGNELGLIKFHANGNLEFIAWFKHGTNPYDMFGLKNIIMESGMSEEPLRVKYALQMIKQNGQLTIEQLIPEVEYYAQAINTKKPSVKFNDKLIFAKPVIYEEEERG